ncbi:MAG: UvrD-helicase domain-containing protein, partial [Alphaproteobacteria bacterium]
MKMESSERDKRTRLDAIDSGSNVWLSASAGSGKTTVLVDRILRLLLDGAPPERLLCLTYTRAAAAEMLTRLAKRLSLWVVDEGECEKDLLDLLDHPADDETKARARRLFFLALDSPGGIRVRTIHAFCQELLRRFPLEAGIAPGFRIFSEDRERRLRARARLEGLQRGMTGDAAAIHDSFFDAFLTYVPEGEQGRVLERLWGESDTRLHALPEHFSDGAEVAARFGEILDWEGDFSLGEDDILSRFIAEIPDAAERAGELLSTHGSRSDAGRAGRALVWLRSSKEERLLTSAPYFGWILTAKGGARQKLVSQASLQALSEEDGEVVQRFLESEAVRALSVVESMRRYEMVRASTALTLLTHRIRSAYEESKRVEGVLDYDDLILLARNLLESSDWVRWKLDGGFHHVLIDEAQDTGPDQWQLIGSLIDDFYSGESAHEDRGGRA